MAFKINVSHKGKAYKLESENEILVGKRIGEKISGNDIDDNLKGYELEITGTSDLSGIPGFKGLEGPGYHRRLLTYGKGMKNRSKGLRLRKTNRGEEISAKTHQINIKVAKEGDKKFNQLVGGDTEESGETPKEEAPKGDTKKEDPQESKPEKTETKPEEKKEEKPEEQTGKEEPGNEKKEEPKTEEKE